MTWQLLLCELSLFGHRKKLDSLVVEHPSSFVLRIKDESTFSLSPFFLSFFSPARKIYCGFTAELQGILASNYRRFAGVLQVELRAIQLFSQEDIPLHPSFLF